MNGKPESEIFYTPLQRRLHWLVLLLVLIQYALQWPMQEAMALIEQERSLGLVDFLVTTLHAWGGITIAALMIWRWQLRRRAVPLLAGNLPERQQRWIRWHHVGLYVVILLMALTGIMQYFFSWQAAASWHYRGKWLLAVMLLLHVAGSLSHGRLGLRVLHRMMGRGDVR